MPTSEGVGWAPRAHLWGRRPPQSHYGPRCLPGSGPHPAGESGAQRASEPLTGRHVRPTALVPPHVFTSCPLVTDVTTRNNTHSPSRGSQAISRNGQEGKRAASERRPRGLSRGETQPRTQCGHRAQGPWCPPWARPPSAPRTVWAHSAHSSTHSTSHVFRVSFAPTEEGVNGSASRAAGATAHARPACADGSAHDPGEEEKPPRSPGPRHRCSGTLCTHEFGT